MTEQKKSVWGLFSGGKDKAQESEVIGELVLTIIDGKLLRNTELIGKMDPYVCVEYRKKKYKTDVDNEAGKMPVWNN